MKKGRFYILTLIAGMLCAMGISVSASGNGNREKARYYYLLGVECESAGNDASAYEYYKRAAELDPANKEASYSRHGMRMRLHSDSLSLQMMTESLEKVREYVDAYPGDYYESRYYAYLAVQLYQPDKAIEIYRRLDSVFPEKTDVLLELAEAYMMTNNLPQALDALSKYEKAEGKSSEISLRKISYMLGHNDSVGALQEARSLVDFNPKNPAYKVLEGHVLEYMGERDSALNVYRKALELDKDNPSTMMALASHYATVGDSVQYDNMIYNVLLSEGMDLSGKLELLAEYLAKLMVDKSSTARGDYLFSVLRDQYPHEPDVLELAASYSAAKEKWSEAEEEISYAIDLRPEKEEYWRQLMVFQISGDKPAEAVKTYTLACEKGVEPSFQTEYLLASAYSMSGDYDRAIKQSEKLIHQYVPDFVATDSIKDKKTLAKLDSRDLTIISDLLCGLGDAYNLKGDTLTAFKVYDNSLLLNPDNSLTLNNYAYYLSLRGENLDKAQEMSRHSLDIAPDNPTFLDTYAWIQFMLRNYEEAKKYQSAAIEKTEADDISEELYSHYGDILFMCGEPEEAVEYWKKALELAPDNKVLQKKVKNKAYYYD